VNDSLGDHETLPARQLDRTVPEVDDEPAVENEKEFVFVAMLMPVVFARLDRPVCSMYAACAIAGRVVNVCIYTIKCGPDAARA
jgi:hypothetical protein